MENKKRLIIVCTLLVIAVCTWIGVRASTRIPEEQQIKADQVAKIVGPSGQLDAEEAEKMIHLFNNARYRGKDVGYDTTAEGAFSVYFKDGSILLIQNYGGKNYCVLLQKDGKYLKNNSFFITSDKLRDFYNEVRNK